MLQKLFALIFVLAVAGQAWASACACGESRPMHSCCKRAAEKNSYLSTKGCCDDERCVTNRSTAAAASLSQSTIINVETAASPRQLDRFSPAHFLPNEPVRGVVAKGFFRQWPRPPDLYVRHHAFLI